jgi:hypothetical protein
MPSTKRGIGSLHTTIVLFSSANFLLRDDTFEVAFTSMATVLYYDKRNRHFTLSRFKMVQKVMNCAVKPHTTGLNPSKACRQLLQ